jgi:hypothetical protein
MSDPKPYEIVAGGDPQKIAPHIARNTAPIIEVLRTILPDNGLVLEIASGSGEQALQFARTFPILTFQPSDHDPAALASIEAWRVAEGPPNLLPPIQIDASITGWPIAAAEALLCINMIHICPWEATLGLMAEAGRLLAPGCPLYLYGAYRRQGVETVASNESFDLTLRQRNPAWGLRCLEDVEAVANQHGLYLDKAVDMPANNLSVIFRKNEG